MLLDKIAELKKCFTEEDFINILEDVTNDIKFNRIGFNKRTSQKQFGDILDILAQVVLNA